MHVFFISPYGDFDGWGTFEHQSNYPEDAKLYRMNKKNNMRSQFALRTVTNRSDGNERL